MENRIDYTVKASLLKALSNPVRLQIVHSLLRSGCHNVSCMEQSTGMSQSCISQHLQKLRSAGVVTARRSGNEVYYSAASPEVAALVDGLTVGPFWSRHKVRVQDGKKVSGQVIDFLLDQQYIEATGDGSYRLKK